MGPAIMMQDGGSATIILPDLVIVAISDNYYITANERYLYTPTLCKMIDNIMYVPVRALAKAFGSVVTWDEGSKTVFVSLTSKPLEHGDSFYDKTDLYWMSRIISAEARGECITGKIAVGNVVMNRLRSSIYPDTVRGVIFDKRCGVQFSPAYSGSINRTPDSECIIAAKLALDDADVVGDSMYFNATYVRGWAARSRTFVTTIGNHNFYV
jgi:N-acetylmuramoyl-L-alanine amidase